MERKFKAIAMRFTQEEFDGMDKTGMTVYNVCDFSKHPYLINNYSGKELWVTNYSGAVVANNNRTVIETCNPKLFRQYCGLENSVEDEFKDSNSNDKKEFRAIAMRCTQEDFDRMDKTEFDIFQIGNFEYEIYLVNNCQGKQRLINNTMFEGDCSVLEFWDEDMFRMCSGLEPKSKKKVDEKGVNFGLKFNDDLSKEVEEIKERMKKYETHLNRGVSFSNYLYEIPFEQERIKELKEAIGRMPFSFGVSDIHNDVYLKGCFSKEETLSDFEKGLKAFEKTITGQTNEKEIIVSRKDMADIRKNSNDIVNDILLANFEKNLFSPKDKPIEKNEKTFQTKDIQIFIEGNNKWADVRNFPPDAKFRFKPDPTKTLDAEIEALNQKAKEMGFKAVVTFESL